MKRKLFLFASTFFVALLFLATSSCGSDTNGAAGTFDYSDGTMLGETSEWDVLEDPPTAMMKWAKKEEK